MHGTRGGLVAGVLFVLPGMVAIMALSRLYALHGALGWVEALFFGLKAVILAIVLQAMLRIGRRALRNSAMRLIALLSFVAIFAFGAPFPLIVASAGLIGWLGARAGLARMPARMQARARRGAMRAGAAALLPWLAPVAVLVLAPGSGTVFAGIAVFFSQMALVTFGGAHAVLAHVAQQAVGVHGWLRPGEMLDVLGMAESTPGPLIMVLQFVGFLGAFREAGWDSPLLAGTSGGLLTTWVTFAPCFAFIFLGAPHRKRSRGNRALAAALNAVTASVVGVILNLALWFAFPVLWRALRQVRAGPLAMELPVPGALDAVAAGMAGLGLVAVFGLRLGPAPVLAGAAGLGIALHAAGLIA